MKPRPGKVRPPATDASLVAEWPFPIAAALGSSARVKSIDREVRMRLKPAIRACLEMDTGHFTLRMPAEEDAAFAAASKAIEAVLARIDVLPVLPSEVEEILTILPRERLRWTKDGRLESAGTRTVKMRGRSKSVTFHVHDPRHIEEVLDRDLPSRWREDDALESAENRRRAAGKAAATRSGRNVAASRPDKPSPIATSLDGWTEFDAEGFLR